MYLDMSKTWHEKSFDEVARVFTTDTQNGLANSEAQKRLSEYGPNQLTAKGGKSAFVRLLLQFHQPLLYVLIVSGTITAILGGAVDACVIFGVVILNAIIGFIQEARAAQAIEALAKTMRSEAEVLRESARRRIDASGLVPGDIVFLQSGDRVPADMRLFRARELRVAEAALTGESTAVEKNTEETMAETSLADRKGMAYATTLVTFGQGSGIVVATGDSTEVGRVSRLLAEAEDLQTPLTRKIAAFSKTMIYVIGGLAVLNMAVGLLRGGSLFDNFIAAVALAVGAIPEGLPAAVTVVLAIGVSRMAKRRVVIRKMPAVETLGSTTIICTDKTGTLTENRMTVKEIFAGDELFSVSGTGYSFDGEITKDAKSNEPADITPPLRETLLAGLLCNDSRVVIKDGVHDCEGDPTEAALIASAGKAGITMSQSTPARIDAIPFESQRQYMATYHETGAARTVYVKGGLEAILQRASEQMDASGNRAPLHREAIHAAAEIIGARGMRVLAFAGKQMPQSVNAITETDIDKDLVFLGLQGMMDPPRAEAITAVGVCKSAGIKVKMITGDHASTAVAIAREIGLFDPGAPEESLTGAQLEGLSDKELEEAASRVCVFARVAPEQKLRLVRALQARGEVSAMTGDGVNDAPALRQADIGVAMGITGTDVAKEAADMVLTDDNFASIQAAVEEGRTVFDNLTKVLVWTLPTNFGLAFVIMAATIAGIPLPILPVQILWINMTTVVFLGTALSFEIRERDIMQRMPRDPRMPIISSEMVKRILIVGFLLLIGSFGLFEHALRSGASKEVARTIALNVFVMVSTLYLFNCRSMKKTVFSIGFFSNKIALLGAALMILMQIAVTYVPFMNPLLHTKPISLLDWCRVFSVAIFSWIVVELHKILFHRKNMAGQTKVDRQKAQHSMVDTPTDGEEHL